MIYQGAALFVGDLTPLQAAVIRGKPGVVMFGARRFVHRESRGKNIITSCIVCGEDTRIAMPILEGLGMQLKSSLKSFALIFLRH